VTKGRLLLIIFGAALVVSHYSLAFIYLGIVAVVFIISRVKPKIDDTLNTTTVLLLFVMTFSWYALWANSPLTSLIENIKGAFGELITNQLSTNAQVASSMYPVPPFFTVTTWINLLLVAIPNLFLIIGVLAIILRSKGKGISAQFKLMLTMAAVILTVALIVPSIASTLNFTRFYGITLLFVSPCFVLGGQTLLAIIGKAWTKITRPLKRQIASKSKNIDRVLLLIAIILGAYFLSQVGFINRVTGGSIYYYNTNFDRMITSNESQAKLALYVTYTPAQDVFSASWLSDHKADTAEVFCDSLSGSHVLLSYGLIPNELLLPITNTTIPPQGSFVYLGSLNIVNGVITSSTGSFNTSEISFVLGQNNLIYSNDNSEIWSVAPAP
jgi:uncharacterized membrane protein